MLKITFSDNDKELIKSFAPKFDIGGYSNLSKNDLAKASRLDFQYTGLYGELAWNIFRYKSSERFKDLLDYKFDTCKKASTGDFGFDDSITANNKTRYIDIKSSYSKDEERIKYLNLIVPQKEYHPNMIYIAAFTIGKSRTDIDYAIISGWCINEDLKTKWKLDPNKFSMETSKLRPIDDLKQYIWNQ